ncbi:MAG: choice-of-anchor tandem repeat GloVer-containing protein [Candidatus Sulfotelmatobacter sp.]
MLVLAVLAASPAHAQTYTVIHSFGSGTDGSNPTGLTLAEYLGILGVTQEGGSSGHGTAYSLTRPPDGEWTETILHSFSGTDGSDPFGVPEGSGISTIYGSTFGGGAHDYGTVFRIARGVFTDIYNFCAASGCSDGAYPLGVLPCIPKAGDTLVICGTTEGGGADGKGAVFEVSPTTGVNTVVHSFAGGTDGAFPNGGLVSNNEGGAPLYGTTNEGGTNSLGTVFKMDTSTNTETVLHSFSGPPDGEYPLAGLLMNLSTGNLYGTTQYGGTHGYGTVFEVSAAGTETVLYSFTGGSDGASPQGTLVSDTEGNLYGTAMYTLFKLSTGGTLTVLYTFCTVPACPDGEGPTGALAGSGNSGSAIYGTTFTGGAYGGGVAFEVTFD